MLAQYYTVPNTTAPHPGDSMKHSKTLLFLFILVLCAGFCATSAVAGLSPEFISSSATDSIRFSSAGDEENSVVMPEPVLKKEIISPDRRYVPGVVILVYDLPEMAATGPEHIISASVNAGIGAVVTESYVTGGVLPGYQVVSLPEGMSVDEALIYYGNQPGVAYAQPDFIYAMDTVPDDPLYGLQWGLQNTGQGTPPSFLREVPLALTSVQKMPGTSPPGLIPL